MLLAVLVACGAALPESAAFERALPDCVAMCDRATAGEGACLDGMGVDWTAAGYADAADFTDACRTWAWERRQEDGTPATASACASREAALAGGTCDDYRSVDWNAEE